MAHIQLSASERTQLGTPHTRRLRRQGRVPGVLYQRGEASIPFSLDGRELRHLLHGDGARTAVIDLAIDGRAPLPALVKEWQTHPVRDVVIHVDLQQVDLTEAVEAPVALVLTGNAIGVRDGGVLDQTVRDVIVRALPDALPESLEHDVSELEIGSTLQLGDVSAPEGVEIVGEPETVVASITAPSEVVEEVEEVEEEEVEGEAAPPAEGEAPSESEAPEG
jgi:large subunit ribosomal protein L25